MKKLARVCKARTPVLKGLKKASLVSTIVTITLVFLPANFVYAVETTAMIPVGAKPEGVAYDSGIDEIFVTHPGGTVSGISDAPESASSWLNYTRVQLRGARFSGVDSGCDLLCGCFGSKKIKPNHRFQAENAVEQNLI